MPPAKKQKEHKWSIWNKPTEKVTKRPDVILFDEDSRKEYVTGFSKRKKQRKSLAQAAIQMHEKNIKRQQKQEKKKQMKDFIQEMIQVQEEIAEEDEQFKEKKQEKASQEIFESDNQKVITTVSNFEDDEHMEASIEENCKEETVVNEKESQKEPTKKRKVVKDDAPIMSISKNKKRKVGKRKK